METKTLIGIETQTVTPDIEYYVRPWGEMIRCYKRNGKMVADKLEQFDSGDFGYTQGFPASLIDTTNCELVSQVLWSELMSRFVDSLISSELKTL